jgi:hypothetical protein
VWKGDGEVVIELATEERGQTIRGVSRMRSADIAKAFWIVEDHAEYLAYCWRRYHD